MPPVHPLELAKSVGAPRGGVRRRAVGLEADHLSPSKGAHISRLRAHVLALHRTHGHAEEHALRAEQLSFDVGRRRMHARLQVLREVLARHTRQLLVGVIRRPAVERRRDAELLPRLARIGQVTLVAPLAVKTRAARACFEGGGDLSGAQASILTPGHLPTAVEHAWRHLVVLVLLSRACIPFPRCILLADRVAP